MVNRINSMVYSMENINRLRGEAQKHAKHLQLAEKIGQMSTSDIVVELGNTHSEKDLTGVLGMFLTGVKGGKISYSA